MVQIINFLTDIELFVYFFLGIIAVIALRKLLIGSTEFRSSVFGLERDTAQKKIIRSITILVLIALMVLTEFITANILVNELPQQASYATPTLDLAKTSTQVIEINPDETPKPTTTAYPQASITGVPSDCKEGILEFTFPTQGEAVSGVVELIGTVNTLNFGSYKYEFSTKGDIAWITIAAGGEVRIETSLGYWYTGSLIPGDYLLRLVALDNIGVEQSPCVIEVKVDPDD
ncbi:MAG: hypothetical protein MUO40_11250 [Anaerolineaceae bacterium]|nr:hypothetical protein [Anaerolineaceae bacterium]